MAFVALDASHSCHASGIDHPLIDYLGRLPRRESLNEVDLARRRADLCPLGDVLEVESLFERIFDRQAMPVRIRQKVEAMSVQGGGAKWSVYRLCGRD